MRTETPGLERVRVSRFGGISPKGNFGGETAKSLFDARAKSLTYFTFEKVKLAAIIILNSVKCYDVECKVGEG